MPYLHIRMVCYSICLGFCEGDFGEKHAQGSDFVSIKYTLII